MLGKVHLQTHGKNLAPSLIELYLCSFYVMNSDEMCIRLTRPVSNRLQDYVTGLIISPFLAFYCVFLITIKRAPT